MEGMHQMRSAATELAPEPKPVPTMADLWALMARNASEIAEMRREAKQYLADNPDDTALVLAEARMAVVGAAIDRLAMAVTRATLAPGPASGPVGVPGPSTVPSQRTPPRHPLMSVVRP